MELVNLHDLTRQAIPMYDKLFRTTYQFAMNYGKQYSIHDYRYNYFIILSELILWTIIQLEIFSNHNPDLIIERRFEKLTEKSKHQILLQLDTFNRQNFINSAMFISDDFINSVLSKLTKTSNYKNNIDLLKLTYLRMIMRNLKFYMLHI